MRFLKWMVLLGMNVVLLAGLGACVYGAWMIYPPLGWVSGGLTAAGLVLFIYGDVKESL